MITYIVIVLVLVVAGVLVYAAMQPDHGSTTVTWAMYGKSNFLSKVMCTFMSMDKMVGPDFEAGLASLKAVAEKPAA